MVDEAMQREDHRFQKEADLGLNFASHWLHEPM